MLRQADPHIHQQLYFDTGFDVGCPGSSKYVGIISVVGVGFLLAF